MRIFSIRNAALIVCALLPALALAEIPAVYLKPADALPPASIKLAAAPKDAPVAINADEMSADQKTDVLIAQGHVEAMQGDNILTADKITYFQNTDVVLAEGNVSMLQPNGDVFFAEKAELRDGMKKAVIDAFKARFADGSVLVAKQALKRSEYVTTLKKASYTPCNLCEDMAPLWQMNAREATIDDDVERVTYRGGFMEMLGYPMFYIPYLSHPTPNASAKSGFLTPTYVNDVNLGTVAKVPYYWRIDQDKDVVITPWLTTQEGPLLQWDYRQLRDFGNYRVRGSVTDPQRINNTGQKVSGNEFRGHIYAQGDEALTDETHVGFDIQASSDDTYLRRYSFGDQQSLFSRAYVEQADGRNFALAEGVAIQGLRSTDSQKTTPLVMPILQGYAEQPINDSAMKLHIAGDAQILRREQGVDQRRLSITPGVTLPFVTNDGQVLTASVNVRQDFYSTSNLPLSNGDMFDGTTLRTLPQAALEWRYPLISTADKSSWIMEPVVMGVVQPNGGNPEKISNEDSKLLELSDTNLFSLDRMPGLDLNDGGSRIAYGLRSQYYTSKGITLDAMLGQNYSFNSDTPFPNSTREGEQFSDYIGRLAATYQPFNLAYRFALDNKDLVMNRNEVNLGFSKPWLSLGVGYRSITNNRYLGESEEGSFSATLPLTDAWSIYGGATRDLQIDQMVSANGGLIYKNECFTMMLDSTRSYARDRDIEPTTLYTFRVGFKNLGEFGGN